MKTTIPVTPRLPAEDPLLKGMVSVGDDLVRIDQLSAPALVKALGLPEFRTAAAAETAAGQAQLVKEQIRKQLKSSGLAQAGILTILLDYAQNDFVRLEQMLELVGVLGGYLPDAQRSLPYSVKRIARTVVPEVLKSLRTADDRVTYVHFDDAAKLLSN